MRVVLDDRLKKPERGGFPERDPAKIEPPQHQDYA
jgi:hypothetical protein